MIVGGETGMLLPSGEREKEMQKNVESQTIGFGEIWDFRIVPLPAIIAGRFDRKTVKSESRTRPNNTFRLLKFLLIKKQIIRRVINCAIVSNVNLFLKKLLLACLLPYFNSIQTNR